MSLCLQVSQQRWRSGFLLADRFCHAVPRDCELPSHLNTGALGLEHYAMPPVFLLGSENWSRVARLVGQELFSLSPLPSHAFCFYSGHSLFIAMGNTYTWTYGER